MLTDTFLHIIKNHTGDTALANNLWLEIFTKYSEPKRRYHTITHLESMVSSLNEVKEKIEDWDTTLLAVYYHDVIYKPTSSTNEEDSAKLAAERLKDIGYPADKIKKCTAMILATKTHEATTDNDTAYLLDADLAILGQSAQEYYTYTEQIREEYNIYPDLLYKPGRKKVLRNFLQLTNIFNTKYFRDKFETQAITNIKSELQYLNR